MNDRLTIETPENVELSYELAGIGSRAIAALLDHLLILAGVLGTYLLTLLVLLWLDSMSSVKDLFRPGEYGQLEFNTRGYAFAFLLISWFVIIVGYYLFFETRSSGQSPGKRVGGLRVVRDDGSPVTFADVALRTFLRPIDFLPFGYFAAIVMVIVSGRSKRIGDYAAGTLVIRLQRDSAPAPFLLPPREGLEEQVAALRRLGVHRLSEQEAELALSFLQRRDGLDAATRGRLASEVAGSLARRLGTVTTDPEAFVEALVLARHRESGESRESL